MKLAPLLPIQAINIVALKIDLLPVSYCKGLMLNYFLYACQGAIADILYPQLMRHTVLENWESLKKKCLGMWLVQSESSRFLILEILYYKIFSIWPFAKIHFDCLLLNRFRLQNPIEIEFSVREKVLWKIEKSIIPLFAINGPSWWKMASYHVKAFIDIIVLPNYYSVNTPCIGRGKVW